MFRAQKNATQLQRFASPNYILSSIMQALLTAMGVLSLLISEVKSLSCHQCTGTGSCSGSSQPCLADASQCITGIHNETMVNGGMVLTAFKNCLDLSSRKTCSKDLSFRNSQIQVQLFAKCCSKDGCNAENVNDRKINICERCFLIGDTNVNVLVGLHAFTGGDCVEIGPVDLIPNGYKCGECSNNTSATECISTKEVLCTGNHFYCGSFNGTRSKPGEPVKSHSFKGCISLDTCNTGIPAFVGLNENNYDLKCTPAIKV